MFPSRNQSKKYKISQEKGHSEVGLQTDNSLNSNGEEFGGRERPKKTDIQDSNSKKKEKISTEKEKTPVDRDVNRQQHRCSNKSYGTTHR